MKNCITLLFMALLVFRCGSWGGNPINSGTLKSEPSVATKTATSTSTSPIELKSGEVVVERIDVDENSGVSKTFQTSRLQLNSSSINVELSLVNETGQEVAYRRATDSDPLFNIESLAAGVYDLFLKNNSDQALNLKNNSNLIKANEREEAVYKDYTLKSFVVFARTCLDTNSDGNTVTHKADTDHYFVQPFVFFGKVDGLKKVTPISADLIQIKQGDSVLTLSRLDDLNVKVYRELGVSDADNLAYTKAFYSGYFGAAGQMYTTDTFRFGGNCANATQFSLGKDVGQSDIKLILKYQTSDITIDESIALRPTLSSAFSVYESSGNKLSDYTQCTYNRSTGEPQPYNGSATECKQFSLTDQPYIKLDYQLPSQAQPGVVTTASDPTRVIFYGHSYPKKWYETLLANSSTLISGLQTSIELPGCLNNGGITSTPLSVDKTLLPLNELNVAVGDVISLAYRTGSYTSLKNFYQGNIDNSQTLTYPTCIPSNTETCVGIKTLQVKLNSCTFKADSGVFVGGIMDSFVYPSYFLMSGIIKP